eukprot:403345378
MQEQLSSNNQTRTQSNISDTTSNRTRSDAQNLPFLLRHKFEKRQQWAQQARLEYPGKLPLILERGSDQAAIEKLVNPKFLIPATFSVYELQGIIRQKLNLDKQTNLFLLVNGKHLMKNDTKLSLIYDDHRNEDGFLYIQYATENTLGAISHFDE